MLCTTAAESTTTCPCLNGGIFTGDACVCPTGYAGLYCETETAGGFQVMLQDNLSLTESTCKMLLSILCGLSLLLNL